MYKYVKHKNKSYKNMFKHIIDEHKKGYLKRMKRGPKIHLSIVLFFGVINHPKILPYT